MKAKSGFVITDEIEEGARKAAADAGGRWEGNPGQAYDDFLKVFMCEGIRVLPGPRILEHMLGMRNGGRYRIRGEG